MRLQWNQGCRTNSLGQPKSSGHPNELTLSLKRKPVSRHRTRVDGGCVASNLHQPFPRRFEDRPVSAVDDRELYHSAYNTWRQQLRRVRQIAVQSPQEAGPKTPVAQDGPLLVNGCSARGVPNFYFWSCRMPLGRTRALPLRLPPAPRIIRRANSCGSARSEPFRRADTGTFVVD